jgi:hypothetical protein
MIPQLATRPSGAQGSRERATLARRRTIETHRKVYPAPRRLPFRFRLAAAAIETERRRLAAHCGLQVRVDAVCEIREGSSCRSQIRAVRGQRPAQRNVFLRESRRTRGCGGGPLKARHRHRCACHGIVTDRSAGDPQRRSRPQAPRRDGGFDRPRPRRTASLERRALRSSPSALATAVGHVGHVPCDTARYGATRIAIRAGRVEHEECLGGSRRYRTMRLSASSNPVGAT